MNRSDILVTAEDLISGDRHAQYGEAKDAFRRYAIGWSIILDQKIEPWQVALCMDWLKTCRALETPGKDDTWIDKAGYSALGGELATSSQTPTNSSNLR